MAGKSKMAGAKDSEGWGGRRERAGRPKGIISKRRRSTAAFEDARRDGLEMPIARLLRRMNDATLSEEYRDELAARVAPYCSPRLSSVAVTKRVVDMTDSEVAQWLGVAEEDFQRLKEPKAWRQRMH
jgi:hypothetical protein